MAGLIAIIGMVVFLLLDLQSGALNNAVNIGTDTICPGEHGVFWCYLENSVQVVWNLDGTVNLIISSNATTGTKVEQAGSTAYIVDQNIEPGGPSGNRTSVLVYTPDPGIRRVVPIGCSGGLGKLIKHVKVISGTDNIEPPIDLTMTSDENSDTYTWNHVNEELVDHYEIVLEWDQIEDQIIQVNTTRVVIPRIPNLSYRGTVRAVSVCQQESDAVHFKGTTDATTTGSPPTDVQKDSTGFLAWTGVSVVLIVMLCVAFVAMLIWNILLRKKLSAFST